MYVGPRYALGDIFSDIFGGSSGGAPDSGGSGGSSSSSSTPSWLQPITITPPVTETPSWLQPVTITPAVTIPQQSTVTPWGTIAADTSSIIGNVANAFSTVEQANARNAALATQPGAAPKSASFMSSPYFPYIVIGGVVLLAVIFLSPPSGSKRR